MGKKRFYVVWNGLEPGIYTTWDECQAQIKGVKQALYKAFDTLEEAERAYNSTPQQYLGNSAKEKSNRKTDRLPAEVMPNALAVDAACSGNPGKMEYRGVFVGTGEEVFHFGPIYGTNNIGEFLAIVHGLALLKQKGIELPIYSDSRNALLWVKQKQCKTKLERTPQTEPLFQIIERAERWLDTHSYYNPVVKWETKKWGEVPADFGRK